MDSCPVAYRLSGGARGKSESRYCKIVDVHNPDRPIDLYGVLNYD
jgi:hypothetical protein